MKYDFAILGGVPCTGNHMVRKWLLSYENTYDISWSEWDEEGIEWTLDRIKKLPWICADGFNWVGEVSTGVSGVNHFMENGNYIECVDLIKSKLESVGFRGLFVCGLRHPIRIVNTVFRKNMLHNLELYKSGSGNTLYYGGGINRDCDYEEIVDGMIKEYILRSKAKGVPSLLDGIEDQFNASVPGRDDMIFVPVDILLDLNIKARFDFLRSELSRTDVIFEDGTKSISCVSGWKRENSHNPNMYLLPENRERRDKDGKLYTERLTEIFLLFKDKIMSKNTVLGSRLHNFFESDSFRKWYPMGMNLGQEYYKDLWWEF